MKKTVQEKIKTAAKNEIREPASIIYFASALLSQLKVCLATYISLTAPCFLENTTPEDYVRTCRSSIPNLEKCSRRFSIGPNQVRKAEMISAHWLSQDIRFLEIGRAPYCSDLHVPRFITAQGSDQLWALPKAVVLNSRQSKTISLNSEWPSRIQNAVRQIQNDGLVLVTSYGTLSYNLSYYLAQDHAKIVICPELLPTLNPAKSMLMKEFRHFYRTGMTLFVSPFIPGIKVHAKDCGFMRDSIAGLLADEVYACDVRKKGNMERIVSLCLLDKTQRVIEMTKESRSAAVAKPLISSPRTDADSKRLDELPRRLLFHYTRSRPDPWPGQTMWDYCRSIINRDNDVEHTAFDTLMRILSERTIRAGNLLSRNKEAVISFTELYPDEIPTIRKWRKSLKRWTFELYGIAFVNEDLMLTATNKVIYGDKTLYDKLPESYKWLFQASRSAEIDWTLEREWRRKGDLDLSSLLSKVIVIVQNRIEADQVIDRFGLKVFIAQN